MISYDSPDDVSELYPVMLDGRLIGWIERALARQFVDSIRILKVKGLRGVRVYSTYVLLHDNSDI